MAFLCGVWLRSILASHVSIEIKGYGTPRIGNAAWADYVDSMVRPFLQVQANLQHGIEAWRIVNYKDVVCRIPPKSMGYRHPRNEIFISKDGARYQVCREQDCKVSDSYRDRSGQSRLICRTALGNSIRGEGGLKSCTGCENIRNSNILARMPGSCCTSSYTGKPTY